jgi:hypothetical protein
MVPPELKPEKQAILLDIKRRFKRMQTTDFAKKDYMNDTNSTFAGGQSARMFDGESKTNFTGFDKNLKDKKNFNMVDELKNTANMSIVSGKSAATFHQD